MYLQEKWKMCGILRLTENGYLKMRKTHMIRPRTMYTVKTDSKIESPAKKKGQTAKFF
jgi:hypothetical protein